MGSQSSNTVLVVLEEGSNIKRAKIALDLTECDNDQSKFNWNFLARTRLRRDINAVKLINNTLLNRI